MNYEALARVLAQSMGVVSAGSGYRVEKALAGGPMSRIDLYIVMQGLVFLIVWLVFRWLL